MSVRTNIVRKLLAGISVIALAAIALPAVEAAAQGQGQGAQGAGKGQGMQGGGHGQSADERGGGMGGKGSLGGIFRDITGEDTPGGEEEDSDRPDWAGTPGGGSDHGGGRPDMAGSKRGDMFGDLYVILRDDQGVPILTDEGWVQPIAADGSLIPLDEDGHPVDETLVQEVELGRLNVGRAPSSVLDRRAEEVLAVLSSATEITTDAAGRLVLTVDGEQKTIDSPLENLSIYVALMTRGSIPGLTPDDLVGTEYDFLVDGRYTAEDLAASTSFLAAATDKTGVFTTDEIAYINAFLGVNTTITGDNVTYSEIDYSDFSYDRSDVFENVTTTVLVAQPDGTYRVEEIDVFETVFGGVDVSASGTLDAYTQAADDARAVVNFIHEYEVPATATN